MNTQEILNAEAHITDRITLYYEGMFWKAYERSAYLVCTQLHPYKPTRRSIKKLGGAPIVSIGFPHTSLEKLIEGHPLVSQNHLCRTYGGFRPLNEQSFQQWKNNEEEDAPALELVPPPLSEVERRIREFDLLNHTPYECMLLITELKQLLV